MKVELQNNLDTFKAWAVPACIMKWCPPLIITDIHLGTMGQEELENLHIPSPTCDMDDGFTMFIACIHPPAKSGQLPYDTNVSSLHSGNKGQVIMLNLLHARGVEERGG